MSLALRPITASFRPRAWPNDDFSGGGSLLQIALVMIMSSTFMEPSPLATAHSPLKPTKIIAENASPHSVYCGVVDFQESYAAYIFRVRNSHIRRVLPHKGAWQRVYGGDKQATHHWLFSPIGLGWFRHGRGETLGIGLPLVCSACVYVRMPRVTPPYGHGEGCPGHDFSPTSSLGPLEQ